MIGPVVYLDELINSYSDSSLAHLVGSPQPLDSLDSISHPTKPREEEPQCLLYPRSPFQKQGALSHVNQASGPLCAPKANPLKFDQQNFWKLLCCQLTMPRPGHFLSCIWLIYNFLQQTFSSWRISAPSNVQSCLTVIPVSCTEKIFIKYIMNQK